MAELQAELEHRQREYRVLSDELESVQCRLAELLAAAREAERALLPHIANRRKQREAAAYARLRAAVAAFEEGK